MTSWLLLSLGLPLVGAAIVGAIRRARPTVLGGVSFGFMLLSFCVLAYATLFEIPQTYGLPYEELYLEWGAFKLALRVDELSRFFALVIGLLSTLACLYSIRYMEHEHDLPAYYASYLVFAAGMLGVVLAWNLALFYVFWEMMLIPSYILIARWGTGRARFIALKYLVWTHAGAGGLLVGIGLIYHATGSLDMWIPDLALKLARYHIPPAIVAAALFIGFAVKMAIFPFHNWLPDAHAEAPTPISVLLSGVMIKTGVYGIIRLILPLFPSIIIYHGLTLAILSLITMIWGGLMALHQTDIKRLLAYSSVSQMGYILFALATVTWMGTFGGVLHVLTHALGKGLLFMIAGILMHQIGTRDIREMGGLATRMPITATCFLIGALSLCGAPLLLGFVSEVLIFGGAVEAGTFEWLIALAFGLVGAMITLGYYLWTIKRIFFVKLPEKLAEARDPPASMLIPAIVCAVLTVLFGVLPTPLSYELERIVSYALGGSP